MPEVISIHDFISETLEDAKTHNGSQFLSKIAAYKTTVADLEEASENDRATLSKIRKAVKNIYKSGIGHSDNESSLCDQLERLGKDGVDAEENDEDNEIGTGMYKFGVILRDLSQKFRQLMQNLNNTVMFPLDTFLKAELRNDLRKSFDKALKDYESKYEKLKKEKLQAAKESGLPKSDALATEVAEELEKERRILQLQMCEYLIKVNEIKAKKGAELLQHLIDYYHAQTNYLEDSMETLKHFGMFMQDLVSKVNTIKTRHDEQKRKLVTTREELKKLIETELTNKGNTIQQPSPAPVGYSLHQPQGNKAHGTRKTGFLLKKSDGKVKRLWQRRRVRVADGGLMVYHADESKSPVILPLLTCHVKMVTDMDPHGKFYFDLISNNRTYHLQVDDSKEREEWISVLNNAKQEAFERAMSDDSGFPSNSCESILSGQPTASLSTSANTTSMMEQSSHTMDHSSHPCAYLSPGGGDMMQSMTASCGYTSRWERRRIIEEIAKLPGNDICADCDAKDPEWCSVNLGVLICLECCGVHRELGVHFSRTQSLKMDDLSLNQLLLPRFVGNQTFNEVYESTLAGGIKPKCQNNGELDDLMTQRKNFIRAKYVEHRYVCSTSDGTDQELKYLRKDLLLGVRNAKLSYLLQVYGEHIDLLAQLNPDDDEEAGANGDTALHVALALGHRDMSVHGSRSSHSDSQEDLENDSDDLDILADSNNLAIIEFLVQNSPSSSIQRTNTRKENVLHQCVRYNRPEALKLILKAVGVPNPMLQAENQDNLTPLQMAQQWKVETCGAILSQMELISNNTGPNLHQMDKKEKESILEILDTLNIDWGLSSIHTAGPPNRHLHPPMVDSGNESPGEHRDSSTKQSTQGSLSDGLDSVDHPVVVSSSSGGSSGAIPIKKPPRLTSCMSFSEGSSTPTSVTKPTKTCTLSSASMSAYDHDKQKILGSLSPSLNVATLPRKRSTKGPAPLPPGMMTDSPLHQSTPTPRPTATATLGRKRHSIPDNQSTTPPARPSIPPKPQISLTKSHSIASSDYLPEKPSLAKAVEESSTTCEPVGSSPPQTSSNKDPATLASRIFLRDSETPPSSFYDRNCQTLPRGMGGRMYMSQHSYESSTDDSSIFTSPLAHLHRSKDDTSKSEHQCAAQGSDHIDVILDVLEGPMPSILDDSPLLPHSFLTNHSSIHEASGAGDISSLSNNKGNRKAHNNDKKSSILAGLSSDVEPIQEEECEVSAASAVVLPTNQSRRRVRALYNCDAEQLDEVSFKKGEIIVVTMSNPKEDWWEGYIEASPNRRGLFPMTYVQKISD